MPTDTMLLGYARNRTRDLIYTLSNYGADAEVYDAMLQIIQQAHDDLNDGIDPGDRYDRINGQTVEL